MCSNPPQVRTCWSFGALTGKGQPFRNDRKWVGTAWIVEYDGKMRKYFPSTFSWLKYIKITHGARSPISLSRHGPMADDGQQATLIFSHCPSPQDSLAQEVVRMKMAVEAGAVWQCRTVGLVIVWWSGDRVNVTDPYFQRLQWFQPRMIDYPFTPLCRDAVRLLPEHLELAWSWTKKILLSRWVTR